MNCEALFDGESLLKTIVDHDNLQECSDSLHSSGHARVAAWIAQSLSDVKSERHIHTMSLTGLERAMSPYKKPSSVSPHNYKPLPPPPSIRKRHQRSPSRSDSPAFEDSSKRSSSVYSQTTAFYSCGQPADKVDLDEESHLKDNYHFYSDSVTAVSATMSEPQLLLPRTYKPLSKTPSTKQSPATSRQRQPSALLPPLPVRVRTSDKHVRTISLEQAKAALEAPGKEHLLPEELRARTRIKSRSSAMLNELAEQDIEKPHKPGSTYKVATKETIRMPTMMMLDPDAWKEAMPELTKPPSHIHHDSFLSGTTAVAISRDNSTNASETASDAGYAPVFGLEPERGRTLHRVPRNSIKVHPPRNTDSMAAEYAELLDEPWDIEGTAIVDEVPFEQVAPRPLFSKPLYEFDSESEYSQSPMRPELRDRLVNDDDIDSDFGTPPPCEFWAPADDEATQTGVIPISPPPPMPELPAAVPSATRIKSERLMPQRRKARESAYYPYVGKRRYHAKVQHSTPRIGPAKNGAAMAMHAARAAAKTTNVPSLPRKKPAELLTRATQKAVNLVDKLRSSQHEGQPMSPPSLDQSVTGVYLGWSEESKEDFDASKPVSPKMHYAVGKYTPRPLIKQSFSHTQTPARPLDERALSFAEDNDRPRHSRSGSFFGSLLDFSKENVKKDEKRRQDIKQSIRLVPGTTQKLDEPEERPQIVKNSFSEPDVPIAPLQTAAPAGNTVWGRRVSEFGVL